MLGVRSGIVPPCRVRFREAVDRTVLTIERACWAQNSTFAAKLYSQLFIGLDPVAPTRNNLQRS